MIVNCDKCGNEYEVDETRLPPQGARIKCPTCHNIFLVRPNRSPLSTVSSVIDEADLALNPPPAAAPALPEEEWKVRHIGLTYSFHDLNALRDWLSQRASLDDVLYVFTAYLPPEEFLTDPEHKFNIYHLLLKYLL